ncbi:MAG: prohibitin family protein [Chthoniobacterales bacterium]
MPRFFQFSRTSKSRSANVNVAALAGVIPVILLLIVVLVVLGGIVVVVQAGHVGVIKRLGAVVNTPLEPGLHFKRPFIDKVEQIDIRLRATNAQSTAASRDLQTVTTEVTVTYSLTGELAPQTYNRVGGPENIAATTVEPAIQECVKAVTAKFTAEELVTKRELVKQQIQASVENFIDVILQEKDIRNAIKIASIAITDFDFSDEFNRAIELKVQAEQQALQAKNEKNRRVTQAEAAAEERKLAAAAEAFAIESQSVARADAIRREAEALAASPSIIQLRTIEKWDGVLPKITGGDGPVPFLNVGESNLLTTPSVKKGGSNPKTTP